MKCIREHYERDLGDVKYLTRDMSDSTKDMDSINSRDKEKSSNL